MYVAIALRPNCLFSHSKYLDSSLLVFSLWVKLLYVFVLSRVLLSKHSIKPPRYNFEKKIKIRRKGSYF